MLLRREYNADPLVRRQLFFDASPQGGTEIFAVRGFVHRSRSEEGRNRILPIVTLGVGHFSAIDKAMCLLSSAAPEVGFSEKALVAWGESVRCTLPDAGTERLLNDCPNIIKSFLGGTVPDDKGAYAGTHVFPYSFWIHEPNHVWASSPRASFSPSPGPRFFSPP